MLEHEYSDLMGRETSEQEYIEANAIYMQIDLDKREFCQEWKKVSGSQIVSQLSNEVRRLSELLDHFKKQHSTEVSCLSDWLEDYKKKCGEQEKKLVEFQKERYARIAVQEKMDKIEISTPEGEWCCLNPKDCTFEYMGDVEDSESYVSGSYSLDEGVVEGVYLPEEYQKIISVEDYDGVYNLPELVGQAFKLIGVDTTPLQLEV